MNKPDITVVIAVYNASKSLAKSIESVLGQSYGNWLMICVNDGSTDNSLEILNKYAKKDSRIKVLSQENGGPASARATAYKLVTTPYVTFLDSDDSYSPDMLKCLLDAAYRTNADIIIPNVICEQQDGTKMNWNLSYGIIEGSEMTGEECFSRTFIQPTIHGYNMWKTALVKQFALYENATYNNINADEYIQRLLFLNSRKVVFSGGVYYYHYNPQSITRNFSKRQLGYLGTCRKFINLVKEYHLNESVASIIKEYYFRHIIHLQFRLYKDGKCLTKEDYDYIKLTLSKAYKESLLYKKSFHFKEKKFPVLYKLALTNGYEMFCLTCFLFAKYQKFNS